MGAVPMANPARTAAVSTALNDDATATILSPSVDQAIHLPAYSKGIVCGVLAAAGGFDLGRVGGMSGLLMGRRLFYLGLRL
jgi:hypothetical protein